MEVSTFLSATRDSLDTACAPVEEEATHRASMALRGFNECMAMLREAAPMNAEAHMILEAFEALPLSRQFKGLLSRHHNLAEVFAAYKSLAIRDLADLLPRNRGGFVKSRSRTMSYLINDYLTRL